MEDNTMNRLSNLVRQALNPFTAERLLQIPLDETLLLDGNVAHHALKRY